MTTFTLSKTALVVIDLQNGIVSRPCQPYSTAEVVENAAKLVNAFRERDGFVTLVRVPRPGPATLRPILEEPATPISAALPENWDEIVPEIGVQPSDHIVSKRQWGAFYGTDLDLQLRRRGIDTIVLCGIATGIGVDTTAREAFQHGYNQIFAIDAMSGIQPGEHDYVRTTIFPRIGRIRTTEELLSALE